MPQMPPTAPHGTTTPAAVSWFLAAQALGHDQLMALLPFPQPRCRAGGPPRHLCTPILASEDRSKGLRQRRPFGPPPAETGAAFTEKVEKKPSARKKKSRSDDCANGRCS